MQESFQEKRRASALRSHPTRILRAIAFLVVVGVCCAVIQSFRQTAGPVRLEGSRAQSSSSSTPTAAPWASPSPGYAPLDPKADKLDALVFESFTASGKKGVELQAQGSSGRETERRFLDSVKARIPFMSQGRQQYLDIVADHAQHVASRPSALFQGHVKLKTDDGLVLETDELFYDGYDARVQSEHRVTFSRKDISGEGLGMLYEGSSDAIEFFKNVKIHLQDPDDPPADIEANAACLSRAQNALFLDGSVRVKQGENRVKSGTLQLYFDDNHAIHRALFRDGFELVANGDTGPLGFSFPRANGRKTISGRRLELSFGSSRQVEEVAAGPEAVMIVEPGPQDLPERRDIRGEYLVFKFDENGRLREYLAQFGAVVRFIPTSGVGATRSISADDLAATMDPVSGEGENITFTGNVVFDRREQRGKGAKAAFSEKTARMVVSGGASLDDTVTRVSLLASTIDIDTRAGSFRAWGGVRHTQKGGIPGSPFGGAGSDLLATSRQVIYDAALKKTQYIERVILRAGQDELRAQAIETVETPSGPRITADTDVEIAIAGMGPESRLDARAAKMTYTPQDRKFGFTGSALVRQKDFETKAPEILVALGPQGGFEVRSLEAKGGPVSLRSSERNAEGLHLMFTPGDGRVALEGAPVKLEVDGRRVQGKAITFFTTGDRIEVVGEEGRTETVLQRKVKKP